MEESAVTSTSSLESPRAGTRSSNVLPIRTGVFFQQHDWRDTIEAKLEKLVRLERGWDGYSAEPVAFANAVFALRMLESVCGVGCPAPQIVPGTSGDLQLEWHLERGDLELHVKGPNDVVAWRSDSGRGEQQLNLRADFTAVAEWVSALAEESIAAAAA
jgi:hypothetical protein